MLEPQDIEKQEFPTLEKTTSRLYEAQGKTRTQWKKVADKTANVVITTGGVAIILSVVAILFVIVAESLPLWNDPVTEQLPSINLKQANALALPTSPADATTGMADDPGTPLAAGVDEYQSIAYVVTTTGALTLLSLEDNRVLQRHQIKGLEGNTATSLVMGRPSGSIWTGFPSLMLGTTIRLPSSNFVPKIILTGMIVPVEEPIATI